MLSAQELHCFLCDCVLHDPLEDQWQSFKQAITVWLDCWEEGELPAFTVKNGNKLIVTIQDETIIRMEYVPEEVFCMRIKCLDYDGLWGDSYNYSFR